MYGRRKGSCMKKGSEQVVTVGGRINGGKRQSKNRRCKSRKERQSESKRATGSEAIDGVGLCDTRLRLHLLARQG
jgi:hypothetical protein